MCSGRAIANQSFVRSLARSALASGHRFALKHGMHARLVLLGVITVAGCTQDNPAFDDESGTQGEASSAATSVDTAEAADSGEEGQPLVCELSGGQPMTIEMAALCIQEDLEAYDRWFTVLSVAGSTWQVGACDPNCEPSCQGLELPLTFAPIQVGDLADVGSCLRVSARRRPPVNPDACEYHTAVVWKYSGNVGVPILIARNDATVALPSIEPAPGVMLAGFEPQLVLTDLCSCADYPDDCCNGQAPAPAVFDFDVGLGDTIDIGSKDTLVFDGIEYEFWALDAFETGVCDEPPHVSWALTLK